jgi:hypothetical protein
MEKLMELRDKQLSDLTGRTYSIETKMASEFSRLTIAQSNL